jgi:ADP-heptose:LPS heptosyltransferase
VAVPDADSIHAVDRYWKVIEHLGGGHLVKRFQVPLAPGPMQQARDLLAPFPSPYVAVAVGAKWLTKRWPPEHFAELLRRMYDLTGGTVVLLGAPDDIPLSATTSRSLCGPVLDLTGKTSLPLLAAVLKTCQVMLANDTGPLHLAAALGLPCVAPYTCTKIALHGPYLGPYARATQVACAGSYLKRCPNQMICMSDLTPDHLWPAFHEVLVTCR